MRVSSLALKTTLGRFLRFSKFIVIMPAIYFVNGQKHTVHAFLSYGYSTTINNRHLISTATV